MNPKATQPHQQDEKASVLTERGLGVASEKEIQELFEQPGELDSAEALDTVVDLQA